MGDGRGVARTLAALFEPGSDVASVAIRQKVLEDMKASGKKPVSIDTIAARYGR